MQAPGSSSHKQNTDLLGDMINEVVSKTGIGLLRSKPSTVVKSKARRMKTKTSIQQMKRRTEED